MDAIDIKILKYLKENSRINASLISEEVHMSVSAVIERIRKMESAGIKQYTIVVNEKVIGKDITAFVSVTLEHPKFNDSFTEAAKKNKDIVECHYITGDFDFILKVVTETTQTLEGVLKDVKAIKGVSKTYTIIVLSTVKNDFTVLPDMENGDGQKINKKRSD